MPFFILLILSLFILNGCSTTSPAITQYTISLSYHVQDATMIQSHKTLRVVTSEALSSLNTKNIRYTLQNNESGAYLYGRWSDTPSLMITQLLVSSLEAEKMFSVVMTTASNAQSDWILESELMTYEHRFTQNGTSQGVIDVSCRLIDAQSKQPISAKRFSVKTDASSNNLQGGVIALQKASEELTRQQIDWIKVITKNIK